MQGYSAEPKPLKAYAALVGTFNLALGAGLPVSRDLPERPLFITDLALLGVATHKYSRLMTKDRVTSVLRAPFVRYQRYVVPARSRRRRAAKAHGAQSGNWWSAPTASASGSPRRLALDWRGSRAAPGSCSMSAPRRRSRLPPSRAEGGGGRVVTSVGFAGARGGRRDRGVRRGRSRGGARVRSSRLCGGTARPGRARSRAGGERGACLGGRALVVPTVVADAAQVDAAADRAGANWGRSTCGSTTRWRPCSRRSTKSRPTNSGVHRGYAIWAACTARWPH